MILTRDLTEDEKHELADLNNAVSAAIEVRRAWLDTKMHECSRLQPGDDIYDVNSGVRLGEVTEIYRYWADRDEGVRDTSLSCEYRYRKFTGSNDNTSRQTSASFGTREDALREAEWQTARLRGPVW